MRGTDKGGGRRKVPPNEYFPYMKKFLEYFPNGKIFLATDDANYFEELKKEKIPFQAQMNVTRSGSRKAVFDMKVNKFKIGTEILLEILLLSKCDWLLHGASSVAETAIGINLDLHNNSVHLEYKYHQAPFWTEIRNSSNEKV